MQANDPFLPTRTAALERLAAFVPRAGRDYAARRNYDLGPGRHAGVSTLSPYIRHRILTEEEVLGAVLGRHSHRAAEKFVQEVFWRSYWKGWLEMRPAVWGGYRAGLAQRWDEVQTQAGLRRAWEDACHGRTGIDAFDHWAQELAETGYLHNHARMWFASIWIFTLRLPWELGADFFLRHLLDGDPASNTLGWRWVAGLQTRGKTYLARASNIARYTENRFAPQGLAAEAPPLEGPAHPPRMAPPEGDRFDPARPTALVLHEDDLSPGWLFDLGLAPVATAVLDATGGLSVLEPAPRVRAFKTALMDETVTRYGALLGPVTQGLTSGSEAAQWARDAGATQIVTPYAPVGPSAQILHQIPDLPVLRPLRPYDARAWPHATAGLFKFKEKIPALLADMKGLRVA
ncbi:FAD-binding domain-containing protein [Aestuariicoccus sp. MJ-SS9]|uniref:FAD-binding domain-containing protein n=1 Tax=Aestuariicoccus sp. MJ-SS9 TaxID=3079855 RepID=UPI0029091794|nr:FAD-binding domain-containing protein [Aestuariicoccus sp. MJ-SS9]MDU8911193.1 FAD-binding domain-containing protein [Aestuariicoccus sp. MJ-SS9]